MRCFQSVKDNSVWPHWTPKNTWTMVNRQPKTPSGSNGKVSSYTPPALGCLYKCDSPMIARSMKPVAPPMQLLKRPPSWIPPGPRYPVGQFGTGSQNIIPKWMATIDSMISHCRINTMTSCKIKRHFLVSTCHSSVRNGWPSRAYNEAVTKYATLKRCSTPMIRKSPKAGPCVVWMKNPIRNNFIERCKCTRTFSWIRFGNKLSVSYSPTIFHTTYFYVAHFSSPVIWSKWVCKRPWSTRTMEKWNLPGECRSMWHARAIHICQRRCSRISLWRWPIRETYPNWTSEMIPDAEHYFPYHWSDGRHRLVDWMMLTPLLSLAFACEKRLSLHLRLPIESLRWHISTAKLFNWEWWRFYKIRLCQQITEHEEKELKETYTNSHWLAVGLQWNCSRHCWYSNYIRRTGPSSADLFDIGEFWIFLV